MEVLLTIMRTGREADDVGGARGVTARESDILSVAVRVLHDRHGDDPQPPVIADLRDLLREGLDEVRMAAVGTTRKTTSSTGRRFAAFWPTCTNSRTV